MAYDYSVDKKMHKQNTSGSAMYSGQHDPNMGENQMHWHGNTEMKRDEMIADKAGVEDGLSMVMACEVKNAEPVSQNQRPLQTSMKSGAFKIGP